MCVKMNIFISASGPGRDRPSSSANQSIKQTKNTNKKLKMAIEIVSCCSVSRAG